MSHEPCGFESDAQGPVNLVRAYTFLGSSHKVDRLKPLMQRNMAVFEYSTNLYSERFTASITFVVPIRYCFLPFSYSLDFTTMGADRALRPNSFLYKLIGGLFVVKPWGGNNGLGSLFYLLYRSGITWEIGYVKYNIPRILLDIYFVIR